jgi:hypothetical protein
LREACLTGFVPQKGFVPSQARPARQQCSSASSLSRQDSSSDDSVMDIHTAYSKTYKNAASPEMREGCLATIANNKARYSYSERL